jgi:iron uptake system component EfeO
VLTVRRRVLLAALAIALTAASSVLAACGSKDDKKMASAQPPAATVASRVILSGNIPRVTPADYRRPTAVYRRHVRATLKVMSGDAGHLRAAIARGDLTAARRAWLAADERYEEIGAAYGAFGALDAAINGRARGLHRVERALWGRRSTRDAARPALRLARDVLRLRAHVGHLRIDPLDYSLRAHEVLEDTIHLQLSGQASPWSGAALVALRGNVAGTRVVLGSVRALLVTRNPAVVIRADRALAELDRALKGQEARGGALPRWDALCRRDRERFAGLTAAAAERLAYVPGLLDPRPARPVQRAFGDPEVQ